MVLVTLSKVFAPTAVPRSELPKYAVQIVMKSDKMVWVTKPIIIRNPPYTIWQPTARQAAWRLAFAFAANQWRGAKGKAALRYDSKSGKHKAGDIVLAVQARAQEVLKAIYQQLHASLPAAKPKTQGVSEATIRKLEAILPPEVVSAIRSVTGGVAAPAAGGGYGGR